MNTTFPCLPFNILDMSVCKHTRIKSPYDGNSLTTTYVHFLELRALNAPIKSTSNCSHKLELYAGRYAVYLYI